MKKILLLLTLLVLALLFYPGIIRAQSSIDCSSFDIQTKPTETLYSIKATGCQPNTLYVLGGTGLKQAPSATSNTSGNLLISGSLSQGTYSITLFNSSTNTSVYNGTLIVGNGVNSPPISGGETSQDYLCDGDKGINTAIGCIPFENPNDIAAFFLRWGLGIAGGIAMILIIIASFMITTSSGDPKRVQAGKELLMAAIGGVVLIIFSTFILQLIGVKILNIF